MSLRRHAEDGCAVVAGIVRSWPPFDPFVVRWDYPRWHRELDLDPASLYRPPRRKRAVPAEKEPPEPSKDPTWLADHILTNEPQRREAIIIAAVEQGVKNVHRAKTLLVNAETRGIAHRWKLPKDTRAYYAGKPQPELGESA